MQNWKIKRMSSRRIHAWIIAINKLLAFYEGKVNLKSFSCPFCLIIKMKNCKNCLWKIIEGQDCVDFVRSLPFRPTYDLFSCITDWDKLRKDKRYRVLRIPMLRKWKKILKIELARREQ